MNFGKIWIISENFWRILRNIFFEIWWKLCKNLREIILTILWWNLRHFREIYSVINFSSLQNLVSHQILKKYTLPVLREMSRKIFTVLCGSWSQQTWGGVIKNFFGNTSFSDTDAIYPSKKVFLKNVPLNFFKIL